MQSNKNVLKAVKKRSPVTLGNLQHIKISKIRDSRNKLVNYNYTIIMVMDDMVYKWDEEENKFKRSEIKKL